MNIYQKLAEARLKLRQTEIKKTGYNTYSKYYYFELGDFLSPMMDIFEEQGTLSFISFGVDIATLTYLDKADPSEQITITSPMSTAKLTACHEVQNLGAVQTYLRRYLYIALMEMLEHDACDASNGVDKTPPKKTEPKATPPKKASTDQTPISENQVTRLCTLLTKNNWDTADFSARLVKKYSIDSKKKIPVMLYEEICNIVEGK
jgi:hypothetical protein